MRNGYCHCQIQYFSIAHVQFVHRMHYGRKIDFLFLRLVLNVTGSLMAAHAGSHSITRDDIDREWNVFLYWWIPHSQDLCVCASVLFLLCLVESQTIRQKQKRDLKKKKAKKKKHRSQAHFTSSHPFPHSGCWHATQLVTAWITLHEGLGQRITLEIQFCATSNVGKDPSDAVW